MTKGADEGSGSQEIVAGSHVGDAGASRRSRLAGGLRLAEYRAGSGRPFK